MTEYTVSEKEVLQSVITKYGNEKQVLKCIEEMSELTKELCKNCFGKTNTTEIAEEIADVEIMLEQMKMIYNLYASVSIMRTIKIANLERKINER